MKVWVIGRDLPADWNNMNGSFEYDQARALASRGIEVYYPAIDPRSFRHPRKLGIVKHSEGSLNTVVLNIPIGGLIPVGLLYKIRPFLLKKLYRFLYKHYGLPDIIHIHYPAAFDYNTFESYQQEGTKIVCTEHWSKVQEKELEPQNLENLLNSIQKSNAFICVGHPLERAVRELTKTERKIFVVPNIVPSMFNYDDTQNEKKTNIFRFVAAGRLVPCKCFDLLIDAFSQVFSTNPNVVLDIIGDGEQYHYLNDKINKIGCCNQIHLMGLYSREQIAQYDKKSNALVLASNLETFGVPVIEALACGMPVVTTNAIGFLEYMTDDNSIVIETNNKTEMEKALFKMYKNYDSYDRKNISEKAKKEFGEVAVSEKIINIYCNCLEMER